MRSATLVALALALAAAPAMAANPEDGALNAVYSGLAKARAAHDLAGMSKAFAPEGLLIDQRPGPALDGAALATRLAAMVERAKTDKVSIDSDYRVERRSVMGDVALDAGFMRQTITRPGGAPVVRYARYLLTMRRAADGTWQIIGDAAMPATVEAWNAVTPKPGHHHDS